MRSSCLQYWRGYREYCKQLHPAVVSGSAVAATMPAYRHADEFAALLSPRLRDAIASLNIQHGGYSDVLLSIGRSLA